MNRISIDHVVDYRKKKLQAILFFTLQTVGASKEGDNLVKKAGFCLMQGKSHSPGWIAYEFELDEKGVEHLKKFSRRGLD